MNLITKKKHIISQKKISKNSIKVLYRLNKLGYEAYLVGGSIRDLLLKRNPKDFDIATNATPYDIRKMFKNCRLVGKRFIIAHLIFKSEIIEVSTFRSKKKNEKNNFSKEKNIHGMLLYDNNFGKIEEDAYRRDITINALYYSTKDLSIRDYVGGFQDIKLRIIRLIGDAETRYREDPVRMLRVIRFSVQLHMNIEKKTSEPLSKLSNLLKNIPSARLFNESIKLFCGGYGYKIYKKLEKYSLLKPLFPFLHNTKKKKYKKFIKKITIYALKKTDSRIKKKKICHTTFLFSAILWYPLLENIQKILRKKKYKYEKAFYISIHQVLKKFSSVLGIPKNILKNISKIWDMQKKIEKKFFYFKKKKIHNNHFLNALELFKLRSKTEKN